MTSALKVTNLHKHFGNLHALNEINLEIKQGQFFGLLGPNGAGKSTLINCIGGLCRANNGTIQVMGYDVIDDYREARRRIGIVPQEVVFDPFFTVRETLYIQSGYFGLGRANHEWIENLITELHLNDKANTNMRALSGGMKRRVMIAQALVHKPELVILDEPTAGVDIELRRSLWRFIKKLNQQGQTIILTTHYLEEAEALCDTIAFMKDGQICALDSTENLLAKSSTISTDVMITLAAPLTQDISSTKLQILSQDGKELKIRIQQDHFSVIDLVDHLRQADAQIIDIHTEKTDLEDVFLAIMHKEQ